MAAFGLVTQTVSVAVCVKSERKLCSQTVANSGQEMVKTTVHVTSKQVVAQTLLNGGPAGDR